MGGVQFALGGMFELTTKKMDFCFEKFGFKRQPVAIAIFLYSMFLTPFFPKK